MVRGAGGRLPAAARFLPRLLHQSPRDQQRRANEASENAQRQEQVAHQREATQRIRKQFLDEPLTTRQRFFQQALDETPTEFQRDLIRRNGCDKDVNYDVLQLFGRSLVSTD